MATTRPVQHGHSHHADCGRTDHCHGGKEKYHAHHESDSCTKVMLLSVVIAVVGSIFYLLNKQQ